MGGWEFGSFTSIMVISFTVEVKLLTWLITPTRPSTEITDILGLTPSLDPRLMTSVLLFGSVDRLST
ncbi:hypothetical protein D3C75_1344610 [compost metagenome]